MRRRQREAAEAAAVAKKVAFATQREARIQRNRELVGDPSTPVLGGIPLYRWTSYGSSRDEIVDAAREEIVRLAVVGNVFSVGTCVEATRFSSFNGWRVFEANVTVWSEIAG